MSFVFCIFEKPREGRDKTGKQCRVVHTLHFCSAKLLVGEVPNPLKQLLGGAGCTFRRNAFPGGSPIGCRRKGPGVFLRETIGKAQRCSLRRDSFSFSGFFSSYPSRRETLAFAICKSRISCRVPEYSG